MIQQKKFYKVVTAKRESAVTTNGFEVEYKLNQWVTPTLKGSRLFVFDNYVDAKEFLGYGKRIFLCEVKNPIFPSIEKNSCLTNTISPTVFWKNFKSMFLDKKKKVALNAGFPHNTCLAKEVKLVRLVT